MKEQLEKETEKKVISSFAKFFSLASITLEEKYNRTSLFYLRQTEDFDLETIGDEYLLNLAGDLALDYEERYAEDINQDFTDIFSLTDRILPLIFKNGHEISGIDLLLELERLHKV